MKLVACLITAGWILGGAAALSSGVSRRAGAGDVSEPWLYGGLGAMGAALVLSLAMRLVRPGWRADGEFGEAEHVALTVGGVLAVIAGLVVGFVRVVV